MSHWATETSPGRMSPMPTVSDGDTGVSFTCEPMIWKSIGASGRCSRRSVGWALDRQLDLRRAAAVVLRPEAERERHRRLALRRERIVAVDLRLDEVLKREARVRQHRNLDREERNREELTAERVGERAADEVGGRSERGRRVARHQRPGGAAFAVDRKRAVAVDIHESGRSGPRNANLSVASLPSASLTMTSTSIPSIGGVGVVGQGEASLRRLGGPA